jgi:hypothetical protein
MKWIIVAAALSTACSTQEDHYPLNAAIDGSTGSESALDPVWLHYCEWQMWCAPGPFYDSYSAGGTYECARVNADAGADAACATASVAAGCPADASAVPTACSHR